LNGCEASLLMHSLRELDETRNVLVVPQPALIGRRYVGSGMDFGFLCGNDTPTAFRLHTPHMSISVGIAMTHAAAMRHLIKTVRRGDRTDLDGFEEYVVTRVAHGHNSIVPESAASLCRLITIGLCFTQSLQPPLDTLWSLKTLCKRGPKRYPCRPVETLPEQFFMLKAIHRRTIMQVHNSASPCFAFALIYATDNPKESCAS